MIIVIVGFSAEIVIEILVIDKSSPSPGAGKRGRRRRRRRGAVHA